MNPSISVVVLNYNGARWIQRCLDTLEKQTIFSEIEVIVADNLSTDDSDKIAQAVLERWRNGKFVQNGANLGFCEGNNQGAQHASGQYLFFLNNDTWLETDCLANLLRDSRLHKPGAATPLVLNYSENTIQLVFGVTYDLFGLPAFAIRTEPYSEIFMPPGCSYLIETELFRRLGGFDKEIFLYSDELDLSWRVWLAGRSCAAICSSVLHHRWAPNVNPQGGETLVEFRTSDSKRFYANRNNLLVILKNAQHVLLLIAPLQILLFGLEGVAGLFLLRRWSFFKRTFLDVLADLWRLKGHIIRERKRIRLLRKRGDFYMLRFLGWRLNRWDEAMRIRRFGLPKVSER